MSPYCWDLPSSSNCPVQGDVAHVKTMKVVIPLNLDLPAKKGLRHLVSHGIPSQQCASPFPFPIPAPIRAAGLGGMWRFGVQPQARRRLCLFFGCPSNGCFYGSGLSSYSRFCGHHQNRLGHHQNTTRVRQLFEHGTESENCLNRTDSENGRVSKTQRKGAAQRPIPHQLLATIAISIYGYVST